MAESDRDFFPPGRDVAQYAVPGPGMGTIRPWAPPKEIDPDDYTSVQGETEASQPDEPQEAATTTETEAEAEEHEHSPSAYPGTEALPEPVKAEEPAPAPAPAPAPVPQNGAPREVSRPAAIADDLPPFLREELVPILSSAQQAAAQLIERARDQVRTEAEDLNRVKDQLQSVKAELDERRRQVDDRLAQMIAWHNEVAPIVRTFQEKMGEINARIDEVPELIRTGLTPLASTVSALNPTIAEMTAASTKLLDLEPVLAQFASSRMEYSGGMEGGVDDESETWSLDPTGTDGEQAG
jgi:uncharacterized phage infection (PIP) family protein YhgE